MDVSSPSLGISIYSDSKGQPQPCNVSTFLWAMPKYQLQNAPPDAVCLFFLFSVNAHIIKAHTLEPKRRLHPAMSVLSSLSTLERSAHIINTHISGPKQLYYPTMPLLPDRLTKTIYQPSHVCSLPRENKTQICNASKPNPKSFISLLLSNT